MKKDVTKLNIVWNTIGALAVSFTSLVYMLILTHLYDLNKVGVFSFGFSFAAFSMTIFARFGDNLTGSSTFSARSYVHHLT